VSHSLNGVAELVMSESLVLELVVWILILVIYGLAVCWSDLSGSVILACFDPRFMLSL